MKGLTVNVFRWSLGDCTNGGVTERVNSFILVDESIKEVPFEVQEGGLYLALVKRNIGGREYLHAEPRVNGGVLCSHGTLASKLAGPMAGGNFIYSCDSRFPSPYPISVHDRFETWKEYESMSR